MRQIAIAMLAGLTACSFNSGDDKDGPGVAGSGSGSARSFQIADFTTVDLRIGVERRGWTLTAYAQNLFDERYLAEVIPAPEFGGSFGSPAEGGRYGVELSRKF